MSKKYQNTETLPKLNKCILTFMHICSCKTWLQVNNLTKRGNESLNKQKYQISQLNILLKYIITIVLLQISIPHSYANITPADTSYANLLYNKATGFLESRNYDSAYSYYHSASDIYRTAKNWEKLVGCLNSMGNILQKNRKFEKALNILEESQTIAFKHLNENNNQLADIFHQKSIINYKKGEFNNAAFLEENAISIWINVFGEKSYDVGKGYNNLGLFYKKTGQYGKSLDYYKLALNIWEQVIDSMSPKLASLLNNISTIYKITGDYSEALIFCNRALNITLANKPLNKKLLARKYNNLGIIYDAQGDTALAYENFIIALELRLDYYKKPNLEIAESYNNIGKINKDQNNYNKALEYYFKALKIRQNIYNGEHPKIALNYFNISSVYINKRDFNSATLYNFKALKIWNNFYSDSHPNIALCYLNFSKIDVLNKKYKSALKNIMKASNINLRDGKIQDERIQLQLLSDKADIYISKYYQQHDLLDLENAVEVFFQISSLIDNLRKSYKAKGSMLILAESFSDNFRKAVKACYKLYQNTNEKKYIDDAFFFAEKNRSSVLTEAILETRAQTFSGILDSLINREKYLQEKLSDCDMEIHKKRFTKSKRDNVGIRKLELQQELLNKEYEKLILLFENNYAKYFQLKYNTAVINIKEVQNAIDPGSSLIEYVVFDSVLYTISISKAKITFNMQQADSLTYYVNEFYQSIASLTVNKISNEVITRYLKYAYKLYSILLQPIEDKTGSNKLIIITDGELGYIPFDALTMKPVNLLDRLSFKELPYLINKYSVTYANSATILFNLVNVKEETVENNFVGFAPFSENNILRNTIINDDTVMLDFLPGTITELANINKHISGDIIKGKNATKEKFISCASNYKVLHIATHGIINNLHPLESCLIFYPANDSSENKLTTSELFNLNIKSEMAVLSACNTGYGKINRGEGIMSLSRGFSYAGVPGIAMSLWNVNDNSTAIIMDKFYHYLSNGVSRGEALRLAKLDYISTSNNLFANPYYWGGFIYIGKNDVIEFRGSFSGYSYILLITAILIVIVFFYMRKNHTTDSNEETDNLS